ncbi:hypothetical protein FOL47_000819 [Perkinsus chesapeaki]|uniref:Uncharacterized protein n=1 Tax=Perkinsus chesapeaki TaxID=330153 RepID=A0A7J6MKP7_PERCH|nr:hypothetical protein FOL47_000819 [Perkinsus chesapeaki]
MQGFTQRNRSASSSTSSSSSGSVSVMSDITAETLKTVMPQGREEEVPTGDNREAKRCKRRRKQVVVVARGLQGSGKSTAMRAAATLLGGIWLNQDEFRSPSKGGGNAKGKFLDKLSWCTHYGDPQYIMVDRINTQYRHRSDIYNAIYPCKGEYPELIYIQWVHPDDEKEEEGGGGGKANGGDMSPFDPIKGRKYFDVCAKNVRNRHGKHRSIDRYADIDFILGTTASQAEPITKEEMSHFSVAKLCGIDVTLDRKGMVRRILEILERDGDFNDDDIDKAIGDVAKIEKTIVPVGTGGGKGGQRLTRQQQQQQQEYDERRHDSVTSANGSLGTTGVPSLVGRMMFQLELTMDSQRLLRRAVGNGWGYMAGKGIVPKDEFHVTLLYVDNTNAFDAASIALVKDLWPRIGDTFSITVAFAVCSDYGVCASPVQFLQPTPCGNMYPHITLGVSPNTLAKESNEMLAGKHPMEALRVLELQLPENQTELELRAVLRVSE